MNLKLLFDYNVHHFINLRGVNISELWENDINEFYNIVIDQTQFTYILSQIKQSYAHAHVDFGYSSRI